MHSGQIKYELKWGKKSGKDNFKVYLHNCIISFSKSSSYAALEKLKLLLRFSILERKKMHSIGLQIKRNNYSDKHTQPGDRPWKLPR